MGATALQNLEIRVGAYGMSTRDADVRGILNQVGLAERVDDKVGNFSLGMRQRMGIALALVGDPRIVVLDEPTNGLDPQGTVEIRDLVRSLPARGATTLLCTHRLAEVEATCDYVVVSAARRAARAGTDRRGDRRSDVVRPPHRGRARRRSEARCGAPGSMGLGELSAEGGVIDDDRAPCENPVGDHAGAGGRGHLRP